MKTHCPPCLRVLRGWSAASSVPVRNEDAKEERIMKTRLTILTVGSALVGGLVLLAVVGHGQGTNDVIVKGPGIQAAPAAAPAAPVLVPAAPSATNVPAAMPVGAVVGWLKSYQGTPALPIGWVECNGQVVSLPGSPYDGMAVPNLNGADQQDKRFLRGSTESGATGGQELHSHAPFLIDRGDKRTVNISSKAPASNLPPYYEVTWIMKVL